MPRWRESPHRPPSWSKAATPLAFLVLHDSKVETLAPTHHLVIDNDQLQQRLGEGPCFDAARSSQGERLFRIADLTGEQPRWPHYVPQAQALGVGSVMGFCCSPMTRTSVR